MVQLKLWKLDTFLSLNRQGALTIHGFIGISVAASGTKLRLIVMIVAAATIIGLGGTLVAEIDYSTKIILNTLGISAPAGATSTLEMSIHETKVASEPEALIVWFSSLGLPLAQAGL